MKIAVQKFGGTSVATDESRLAALSHIERAMEDGYKVVVVVSAMGRQGDTYATDTLLGLIKGGTPGDRERDLLLSCGEVISAVVFAEFLRAHKHDAMVFTGAQAGISTDSNYGNAEIMDVQPDRILAALEAGKIAVVTGFQGVSREGDVTTLGRGGSDTTAAALGVALCAAYVDIFTDVAGIMTADPRVVRGAVRLGRATYEEICHLAEHGAKVIHPRAVQIAMRGNVPMRIRGTHCEDEGTLIGRSTVVESDTPREVTAIAHHSDVLVVEVEADEGAMEQHGGQDAAGWLRQHGLAPIPLSHEAGRLTVCAARSEVESLVERLRTLGFRATITDDCAKVAAVGLSAEDLAQLRKRVLQDMAAEGIEVRRDGHTQSVAWFLVDRSATERAANVLHRTCGLDGRSEEAVSELVC